MKEQTLYTDVLSINQILYFLQNKTLKVVRKTKRSHYFQGEIFGNKISIQVPKKLLQSEIEVKMYYEMYPSFPLTKD